MTFRCNVGDVMTKSHQAIFFMQRSPFYAHTSQSVDLLNLATAFQQWANLFKEAQQLSFVTNKNPDANKLSDQLSIINHGDQLSVSWPGFTTLLSLLYWFVIK